MIIDGFDYGEGYTRAENCTNWSHWWDAVNRKWVSKNVIGIVFYDRSRRPMTEAEKQAEKAKEEKVIITIREISNASSDKTPSIPLSEAARIAQLPEVVAEVERQREARNISHGDWFLWRSKIIRCEVKCNAQGMIEDADANAYHVNECTKVTDEEEISILDSIAARAKGCKP